jgi:hypothetical protein
MFRLTPIALQPIVQGGLSGAQATLYAAWVLASLYFEGYRAFQLRFCPRVVARALYLTQSPRPVYVALAPLFCMGFFHANRRTLALAWGTTTMVVFFILTFRHVSQPWRGIVDGGVVAALGYGVIALLASFATSLATGKASASAELP